MVAIFLIALGLVCISLYLLYGRCEDAHTTIWSLYQELQQEQRQTPIIVRATPGMTAEQLADLLRDAEAILAEQQVTSTQS